NRLAQESLSGSLGLSDPAQHRAPGLGALGEVPIVARASQPAADQPGLDRGKGIRVEGTDDQPFRLQDRRLADDAHAEAVVDVSQDRSPTADFQRDLEPRASRCETRGSTSSVRRAISWIVGSSWVTMARSSEPLETPSIRARPRRVAIRIDAWGSFWRNFRSA